MGNIKENINDPVNDHIDNNSKNKITDNHSDFCSQISHKEDNLVIPKMLEDLLLQAIELQASDLHLSSGLLPKFRIAGELTFNPAVNNDIVAEAKIAQWISILKLRQFNNAPNRSSHQRFYQSEFLVTIPDKARFRGSVFRQEGGLAMVLRQIPNKIASLDGLNAPQVFKSLLENNQGLILLTGATGSGKSTTLAAMIDYLNHHYAKHIICLEDPIEFIHRSDQCLIHQRQIYRDCENYADALRAAMRQDPDILLIGEMRDEETIKMAMRAAETGHLVLSTLHTQSASKAITRIIDSFPSLQQDSIRAQLSQTLIACIWQQLCKTTKHHKSHRVAAWEVLINTQAVANLIRQNKIEQILNIQQCNREIGMQTMAQSIQALKKQGMIQ